MRKYTFIAMCLTTLAMVAQTTKPVTLSDKAPYNEELTISQKSGDVKVTASLLFDETANTVSVTLKSERRLFVFWEDIRYCKAFYLRKLRTDRLSYQMTGNTSDSFRRVCSFRKSLPKPRYKYTFHTWVQAEGMTLVPAEHRIVNDSITATFALPDTATKATIRLRDILLLDEVKQKGVSHDYTLSFGADINTVYRLTIRRNPCFGMEAQITAAQNARDAVIRSFEAFQSIYQEGVVNSEEGEKLFHSLQDALRIQFPVNTDSSSCPTLQKTHEQYNQYIDSIRTLSVTLQVPQGEIEDHSLNIKIILTYARMIDSNVARWLVSNDELEKSDLIQQSNYIITDANDMIQKCGTRTTEERNAVAVFRKAEQYYQRTCR